MAATRNIIFLEFARWKIKFEYYRFNFEPQLQLILTYQILVELLLYTPLNFNNCLFYATLNYELIILIEIKPVKLPSLKSIFIYKKLPLLFYDYSNLEIKI